MRAASLRYATLAVRPVIWEALSLATGPPEFIQWRYYLIVKIPIGNVRCPGIRPERPMMLLALQDPKKTTVVAIPAYSNPSRLPGIWYQVATPDLDAIEKSFSRCLPSIQRWEDHGTYTTRPLIGGIFYMESIDYLPIVGPMERVNVSLTAFLDDSRVVDVYRDVS